MLEFGIDQDEDDDDDSESLDVKGSRKKPEQSNKPLDLENLEDSEEDEKSFERVTLNPDSKPFRMRNLVEIPKQETLAPEALGDHGNAVTQSGSKNKIIRPDSFSSTAEPTEQVISLDKLVMKKESKEDLDEATKKSSKKKHRKSRNKIYRRLRRTRRKNRRGRGNKDQQKRAKKSAKKPNKSNEKKLNIPKSRAAAGDRGKKV